MESLFAQIGPEDPKTGEYFLMEPKIIPWAIMVSYAIFVLKVGPQLLKNVPAFRLKGVLMVYNWIQIILNAYVFIQSTRIASEINPICEGLDTSMSPRAVYSGRLFYYYYLLKVLDLADTLFFLLRKKSNQITVLHVYHHTGMVFTGWTGARYFPTGQGFYLVPVNTFVHVLMYFYYFITAWNPEYAKIITWKKFITQVQIIQHLLLLVVFFAPITVNNCYPRMACYMLIPNCLITLTLFINFYIRNYVLKPKVS